MDWLADRLDISPAEMLDYADLIARYVVSPRYREYLATHIGALIEAEPADLSEHQRARLMVIRAAMQAQLGRLDAAMEDYTRVKQIVALLIESPESVPEDYKASAQADLGIGNIIVQRAAQLEEPVDQHSRRALLQEALERYHAANQAAQHYLQDVVLRATIHQGWSYAYTLLARWSDAEAEYSAAIDILTQAKDSVDDIQEHVSCYARVLDMAGYAHGEKGRWLVAAKDPDAARAEYTQAYHFAQQEIALLQTRSASESEALIWAYLNAADYLIEIATFAEPPVPEPLDKAREHCRAAFLMARRLGMSDKEQEVRDWEVVARTRIMEYGMTPWPEETIEAEE
jgi:tetratricopeptide (TPR) repeat protein